MTDMAKDRSLDALARALEQAESPEDSLVALRQSMDVESARVCAAALQALDRVLPGRAGVATVLAAFAETRRFALRQD